MSILEEAVSECKIIGIRQPKMMQTTSPVSMDTWPTPICPSLARKNQRPAIIRRQAWPVATFQSRVRRLPGILGDSQQRSFKSARNHSALRNTLRNRPSKGIYRGCGRPRNSAIHAHTPNSDRLLPRRIRSSLNVRGLHFYEL